MLKSLKFVNVFVPKMSLATSVLSHGLSDLTLFTIFFFFTIFAFGQLFFITLGPISDTYISQLDSTITLFKVRRPRLSFVSCPQLTLSVRWPATPAML